MIRCYLPRTLDSVNARKKRVLMRWVYVNQQKVHANLIYTDSRERQEQHHQHVFAFRLPLPVFVRASQTQLVCHCNIHQEPCVGRWLVVPSQSILHPIVCWLAQILLAIRIKHLGGNFVLGILHICWLLSILSLDSFGDV